MHTPPAASLLVLVERGYRQPPAYRALLLLAAAMPETPMERLAELPIGARNGCLLRLRLRLFGPDLAIVAPCPACGELLDLGLDARDLLADERASPTGKLRARGYSLDYRLPTSLDLLDLPNGPALAARRQVLQGCVTRARKKGAEVDAGELPDEVLDALDRRLAEVDPQAVTELSLTCPVCDHGWSAPFDIASFLWAELEHWAQRCVLEVHRLASTYGWSESDILALSPGRRRAYLELVPA